MRKSKDFLIIRIIKDKEIGKNEEESEENETLAPLLVYF